MRNETTVLKTQTFPIGATYSVGRKVVAENGEHVIERQDREVVVSVQIDEEAGGAFFRGARIA